jgi:sugar phosphate isomerase/epimerase
MYTTLNLTSPIRGINHCGHIGHEVDDIQTVCDLAQRHGFAGVNLDFNAFGSLELEDVAALLAEHRLRPASFGLSAELFGSQATFEDSLDEFEQHALLAETLQCGVALCYLPPFSEEMGYSELFLQTSQRLRQLQPILARHQIKIGFEFIGPTTTRLHSRHDFIHTIDGTKALIASADLQEWAGFKLDVHHWQNSGAGSLDLQHLEPGSILYVELNDGLPGHTLFTMPEFERELPLSTGVTRVEEFLWALQRHGYDGPVVVEPWNALIAALPLEDAIQRVKASLDRCLALLAPTQPLTPP